MSVKISRSKLSRITVTINDDLVDAMRRAKEIAQGAMEEAALYFHEKILPAHFRHGAAERYGYAKRSIAWLNDKRKRGKPYLFATGGMYRDLKSRAAVKKQGSAIELRMSAEVFEHAPKMTNSDDNPQVRKSGNSVSRDFPNMKRELRIVLPEEKEALAVVIAANMKLAFRPENSVKTHA